MQTQEEQQKFEVIQEKQQQQQLITKDGDKSFLNTTNSSDDQNNATFTEKIKDIKSLKIKNDLLLFIRDIQGQKKHSDEQVPDLVREKIMDIEQQFQEIWNESKAIIKSNGEVIEAVVTKGLYNKLIQLYDKKDDNRMDFQFKIYEFLGPKHLEIEPELITNQNYIKAKQYIQKINNEKTPRDKISDICIACKLISRMLASQNNNGPIGADQFLPILVFAVLQSRPQNAVSNLEFMRDFRSPSRLEGIEQYYFTAYESTLEFIDELDEKKVKLDVKEFKQAKESQIRKYKQEYNIIQEEQQNKESIEEITKDECLSNLFQLKTKIYDLNEHFNTLEKKQKLQFINKSYTQISIGDIPEFFSEYHLLAKHYVDLEQKINNLTQITDQLLVKKQHKKSKSLLGGWFQ